MKNIIITCLLFLGFNTGLFAQADELQAIQRTVDSLYSSLSFEEGEKADTAAFLSIFLEKGTLINSGNGKGRVMSPRAFARNIAQMKELKSFDEHEIRGETVFFGSIAHRFSTYEKNIDLGERQISGRGINSFQLVKVNGRWRINSIVWDDETQGLQIPDKYK